MIEVDPDDPVAHTLQEVIDAGGIRVGDKEFTDWGVVATSEGGAAPGAGAIAVVGVVINGEYGLRFSGGWAAGPGQIADTLITYKLTCIDPNLLISDNSLWMTAFGAAGGGLANITESVYADLDGQAPLDLIAEKFVYASGDGTKVQYAHVEFPVPQRRVWVHKDVGVQGKDGAAAISGFYQTFSQIPEPATAALLAAGVVILGVRRRRR